MIRLAKAERLEEQQSVEERKALLKQTIERAESAPKARYENGRCTKCGAQVDPGDFCDNCDATFLDEKQIARMEKEAK